MKNRLFLLLVIIFLFYSSTNADDHKNGNKSKTNKIQTTDKYDYFDGNKILMWFGNNGIGSHSTNYGGNGLFWPKGSGKSAVFQDGLLWGGLVNGELRVGGSHFYTGMQPGKIINGIPDDTNNPKYEIYKVQNNWKILPDGPEKTRYQQDYENWPGDDGAPYIDMNNNGRWDKGIDIPKIVGDQQLWFVMNDMNTYRSNSFFGTPPIGLEVQCLVWGYNNPGALENVVFKKYTIINKGENKVDSLYFGYFSDVDLGDAQDDYMGCDSSLGIGFVYNADDYDYVYGSSCPAIGYGFLQGPIFKANKEDKALWDFNYKIGYKNLSMTSFSPQYKGTNINRDPYSGKNIGAKFIYQNMKGNMVYFPYSSHDTIIRQMKDPYTGELTKFPLAGDPVTGKGWIDGIHEFGTEAPHDRRIMINSGPIFLIPGDTQEVVLAIIIGQGQDRLSSVISIKNHYQFAKNFYEGLFQTGAILPSVTISKRVSNQNAEVKLIVDGSPFNAIEIKSFFFDNENHQISELNLYDDGLTDNGVRGDKIFGNVINLSPIRDPISVNLNIKNNVGNNLFCPKISSITTSNLKVIGYHIFSDNFNFNHKINPNENVRYGLIIDNPHPFGFKNIKIFANQSADIKSISIDTIPQKSTIAMNYNYDDQNTFLTLQIYDANLSEFSVTYQISDDLGNIWNDTLTLPIEKAPFSIKWNPIRHLKDTLDYTFNYDIVDLSQLKNHLYVIHGIDSIDRNNQLFTLKDSTDGRILLLNHPFPDYLSHNISITDGFKIYTGIQNFRLGKRYYSTKYPYGKNIWSIVNGDSLHLDIIFGAIGWGGTFFNGTSMPYSRIKNIMIKFVSTDSNGNIINPDDPNVSLAYRYLYNANLPPAKLEFWSFIKNSGTGFAFQEFKKTLPFSVWDMESLPYRRLVVGYLENNVKNGTVDGKYWPPASNMKVNNTSKYGPMEWFFIFDINYRENIDSNLAVDLLTRKTPIMWWGTPTRYENINFSYGDEFSFDAYHAKSSKDIWIFTPSILYTPQNPRKLIKELLIYQNYPNPFNSFTQIKFLLKFDSKVSLKIYNVLGQEVSTLIDGELKNGEHRFIWNGKDQNDISVSSGVYFYRLIVSDYTEIKKMMLIR